MPKPRDVFENPDTHWAFMTAVDDAEFESDAFDRKEAARPGGDGRVGRSEFKKFIAEDVVPTVSSFANSNFDGGLLVVGISSKGEVKGIGHLSDEQRQSLADFAGHLRGHSAQIRTHECADTSGSPQRILLIYVPFSRDCICETVGASPVFWVRKDNKKMAGNEQMREQLRREKNIISFENSFCSPFRPQEVDAGVLQEFRRTQLGYEDTGGQAQSDEELLYNVGALLYDPSGKLAWSNAGCLFFHSNPQRVLTHAQLRLLRYEVPVEDYPDRRGAPTFDKSFSGPLSKQIRNARVFLQEAAYFRNLPQRNPDGGFTDALEYPFEAVDEAIVNAMAHRDYGVSLPVECEAYIDGLMVHNPGRVLQRNSQVPDAFTLRDVRLTHLPRNPKLLEWLKAIKDERGAQFVRAVSEGTKTMLRVMDNMGLPAPSYITGDTQTTVTPRNNESERKSLLRFVLAPASTEFSNLFPLDSVSDSHAEGEVGNTLRSGVILEALRNKLQHQG